MSQPIGLAIARNPAMRLASAPPADPASIASRRVIAGWNGPVASISA